MLLSRLHLTRDPADHQPAADQQATGPQPQQRRIAAREEATRPGQRLGPPGPGGAGYLGGSPAGPVGSEDHPGRPDPALSAAGPDHRSAAGPDLGGPEPAARLLGTLAPHHLHDYLAAVQHQLRGYVDRAAVIELDLVGLRVILEDARLILGVSGVGYLEDSHALVYVITGVDDVGRLVHVAAVGVLVLVLLDAIILVVVVVLAVLVIVSLAVVFGVGSLTVVVPGGGVTVGVVARGPGGVVTLLVGIACVLDDGLTVRRAVAPPVVAAGVECLVSVVRRGRLWESLQERRRPRGGFRLAAIDGCVS